MLPSPENDYISISLTNQGGISQYFGVLYTPPPVPGGFLENSWRNYQEFFASQYQLKWSFLVPSNPGGFREESSRNPCKLPNFTRISGGSSGIARSGETRNPPGVTRNPSRSNNIPQSPYY